MAMSGGHHHNLAPIFRTDSNLSNYYYSYTSSSTSSAFFPFSHSQQQSSSNNLYIEKRQLFLRSYQFSRKKTVSEKLKSTLSRARRHVSLRLRSAVRLRRVVWSRLRSALSLRRRRLRLVVSRAIEDGSGGGFYRSWLFGGRSKRSNWTDSRLWYQRIL